jgi:hypothetical protein
MRPYFFPRAGRIKFWSWDCISVGAQTQFTYGVATQILQSLAAISH